MHRYRVLGAGACLVVALSGGATAIARSNGPGADVVPGRVAAFDLVTGALRFGVAVPTASAHVHAIGSGVVIVSGANSCRSVSRGLLVAFSLTGGARRWTIPYRDACVDYSEAAPTAGGTVALQVKRGIAAIDARTGATRWTIPTLNTPAQSTSAAVTTADTTKGIVFLDPRSGRVRARATARRNPFAWLLTAQIGVFVTQGGSAVGGVPTRLTAIDTHTGRRLWQRSVGLTEGTSGPRGADGVVLFTRPLDANTSEIDAFDVRNGASLWQRRSTAPFGDVVSAAGAGVAAFDEASDLVALDLRTGAERWRAGGAAGALNAGSGTVISVGSEIRAFDAETGTLRWHASLPASSTTWYANTTIGAGVVTIASISPSFKQSIG